MWRPNHLALSALSEFHVPSPGALPQAITFRAFGAETRSFDTPSVAPDARGIQHPALNALGLVVNPR
ncbi:MAG: hypothetical protein AABN95_24620 [Acidobacteriota bacterium]